VAKSTVRLDLYEDARVSWRRRRRRDLVRWRGRYGGIRGVRHDEGM